MEIKRKTNILVKTERKFVVRQSQAEIEIWCEKCIEQMITVQSVAVLHNISTREVYRLIEDGKISFIDTKSKVIYICPNCFDIEFLQTRKAKIK